MFDPAIRHRQSIRLKGYNYSLPGAYFVTICAFRKQCAFGEVVDGAIRLNEIGDMVAEWWSKLQRNFTGVEVDTWVIMPNHLHGIISIVGADPRVRALSNAYEAEEGARAGAPLPRVIQWFKTMTTNRYIRKVKQEGQGRIAGRLWQRGYYEHIIRTEKALNAIREYIESNPARWGDDPENPFR